MPFGRLFESRHGPFGEFQREMNDLFDNLLARHMGLGHGLLPRAFPPINVYEDKDALYAECELPGLDHDALDIQVTGDVLSLRGERAASQAGDGGRVHIQERGYGSFNRAITLPVGVDADRAEATFRNGVLELVLPKTPEAKPRQVEVKVEE